MSLRTQAAADLRGILEDTAGFGWPLTLTAPDGSTAALVGHSSDVSEMIDPDTGVAVNGRSASVSLATSSIAAAAIGTPYGVPDSDSKPWLVTFDDIGGNSHTFKIEDTQPDRALGVNVLNLVSYKPLP